MKELSQFAKHFVFDGKSYEIKVFSNNNDHYMARVFLDNKPASDFSYGVDWNVRLGFDRKYGIDAAVNTLIESAMADITDKKWENFLEAMKQQKNQQIN